MSVFLCSTGVQECVRGHRMETAGPLCHCMCMFSLYCSLHTHTYSTHTHIHTISVKTGLFMSTHTHTVGFQAIQLHKLLCFCYGSLTFPTGKKTYICKHAKYCTVHTHMHTLIGTKHSWFTDLC